MGLFKADALGTWLFKAGEAEMGLFKAGEAGTWLFRGDEPGAVQT
jgi:hypothetical protein